MDFSFVPKITFVLLNQKKIVFNVLIQNVQPKMVWNWPKDWFWKWGKTNQKWKNDKEDCNYEFWFYKKYVGVQSWKAAHLPTLEIRVEQKRNRANQVHLKIQFRHKFDQKCPFTDSLHRLGSRFARTSSVPLEESYICKLKICLNKCVTKRHCFSMLNCLCHLSWKVIDVSQYINYV